MARYKSMYCVRELAWWQRRVVAEFSSLVSAQSNLEVASSRLWRARALALRPFSFGLVARLASGAFAGLVFGVSDLLRACDAGWVGISTAAAVVGLWIWYGQVIGGGLWVTRRLASAIKPRLPHWIAWHAVTGAVAGSFTLLLSRKVFGEAAIRRTSVGSWGTWMVPVAVAVAAWAAIWIAGRLVADNWRGAARWTTVCLAASLALGAVVLDAHAPEGYLYLHVLLLTCGLILATETADLIGLPPAPRRIALALALITLPALLAFPATLHARQLFVRSSWAGQKLIDYAQVHIDFDHDGYSPVFGGGDCDDSSSSVFIGAPEQPGDGRDSDCDGLDDPKPSSLSFAPFRGHVTLAQTIAERGKRYPTVVILIDALRYDRVGNPRFPNLAKISRESIRFTHMYSVSATTLTSVPAMVTGRVRPLRTRENLTQSLSRAHQVSVFVAPDAILQHFERGKDFDPLLGFSSRVSISTDLGTSWGGGETVTTSAQITTKAVELLDSAAPPDLIWLHYFDVHQWNALKEAALPAYNDVARYDAVLERLDATLGPLLERRDRVNLAVLADHGEGLGARGVKYHTGSIFEELAHVPCLIRVPGIPAATVDVPSNSTGVFNTLRALRGLEPDTSVDPSLLELVGPDDVGEGPGFASFELQQWSFLYGKHRLLYSPQRQVLELYDLSSDPREERDIADREPRLASELLARLFQLNNEPRQ